MRIANFPNTALGLFYFSFGMYGIRRKREHSVNSEFNEILTIILFVQP